MDLFRLIEWGEVQAVRDYVFQNVVHLYYTRNGITPFLHACQFNNIEIVTFLWNAGTMKNHRTPIGDNALHIAARHGQLDTVDFLITQSFDINSINNNGETPLHLATKHHMSKIALYLMAQGAHTWIKDTRNRTPLMNAMYSPCTKFTMELIDKGAFVGGSLSLSVLSRQFDVTMHLLQKGPYYKREYRETMVYLVQEDTDIAKGILKYMLKRGFNPNSRNRRAHTPLAEACRIKSYDMANLLLTYGASANRRTINNDTPLHLAVMRKEERIVDLLLQHRANPNFRNWANETPLSLACERGYYNIFDTLIYKTNLSIKTGASNRTYLMRTIESNNYRMVEKMLYMGPINIYEEDLGGDTAYRIALENFRTVIVDMIEGAIRAKQTFTMDKLDVTIPIPIWRRLLPSEGKRALDVALQAYKVDSLACYHALFLNEDTLRKKYRDGEVVCFSQAPLRSLTRAMGSRPIRHRIVSNLIFPYREIYMQILNR